MQTTTQHSKWELHCSEEKRWRGRNDLARLRERVRLRATLVRSQICVFYKLRACVVNVFLGLFSIRSYQNEYFFIHPCISLKVIALAITPDFVLPSSMDKKPDHHGSNGIRYRKIISHIQLFAFKLVCSQEL